VQHDIDDKQIAGAVTLVIRHGHVAWLKSQGMMDREASKPMPFLEAGAMQCGDCTSGMIISAVALLQRNPAPKENEIIDFMDGNICRCGTYPRIVTAIQKASKARAGATAGKGAGR